jgi:type I restriction enzyme M protein
MVGRGVPLSPALPREGEGAIGVRPTGRWRAYEYDELIARENEISVEANLGAAEVKARSAGRSYKASLDIFCLKDESLADSDNLPPPEVIAQEIVDDLEAALEQFRLIASDLNGGTEGPT